MDNINPNPLRGYNTWLEAEEAGEAIERIKEELCSDIIDGEHIDAVADNLAVAHALSDFFEAITPQLIAHTAMCNPHTPLIIQPHLLRPLTKAVDAWVEAEAQERYEKDCRQAAREYRDYLADCRAQFSY